MYISLALLSLLSAVPSAALAAVEEKKPAPPKPCTVRSSTTGSYFDLSSLRVHSPESKDNVPKLQDSWFVRGYDYGANFSMNICGPVVETLEHVEGVKESLWQNISAHYEKGGKTYSIGYDILASYGCMCILIGIGARVQN
jgi:cation-dependent mannose-6-phosphate receptor